MTAYYDMLDLEMSDRVFDHARSTGIIGCDDVCNVAVDENVAWLAVTDCGLRNTRVGTSQPKYFGTLALAEFLKEIGTVENSAAGKGFVPGEDAVKTVVTTG